MPTNRKVIKGQQEAKLAQRAEKMLAEGKQNPESVYGSMKPFKVSADEAVLQEVGIVSKEKNNETPPQDKPEAAPAAPSNDPTPQATPEAPAPEKPTEGLSDDPVVRMKQVEEELAKIHPNPPSAEVLMQWKQGYGDVFVVNIDDKAFIFRYLKRREWIQFNAAPNIESMQEHQIEEMWFERCVLWPQMTIEEKASLPAGVISMVATQIKLHSMFLDPGYVMTQTFKL